MVAVRTSTLPMMVNVRVNTGTYAFQARAGHNLLLYSGVVLSLDSCRVRFDAAT